MSRKLVEVSLEKVRRRFMETMVSCFHRDSSEHDLVKYRAKMLFDKTVVGGKNARSLLCLSAFDALQPAASEERREVVAQVAATIEMAQAFFLIADDIMDGSETRRGKPCWYRMPGIGLSGINDAYLLDSCIEDIIRELLPTSPNLERICEAYRRCKRITMIGQLLDTSTAKNIDAFTWDRYEQLIEHKTSHYTYFHPIQKAMLISDQLAGHSAVKKISCQIGFLFQAQDDVLDVFGDPTVTGKVGTDIQDGKCTWVTVRALQKMHEKDPKRLALFQKAFGSSEESDVGLVKSILRDLRVHDEFVMFEKRFSEKIFGDIHQLPIELAPLFPVFENAVQAITNRSK